MVEWGSPALPVGPLLYRAFLTDSKGVICWFLFREPTGLPLHRDLLAAFVLNSVNGSHSVLRRWGPGPLSACIF